MELLTRNNFEGWMQKLMERLDRQDELLLAMKAEGKQPIRWSVRIRCMVRLLTLSIFAACAVSSSLSSVSRFRFFSSLASASSRRSFSR